ncbi:MAG: aminotransferase class I/II-fold pyridoxal phosphate-dependent enzyme [Myxococcota bacterium]
MPILSQHYQARRPSAIRQAQILCAERPDRAEVHVINVAIGNVSLPMHPAMSQRMKHLDAEGSPFSAGVVKYTPSVGNEETQRAFMNIVGSTGAATDGLHCVVTDGGSQAMELMLLGVCGPMGPRPLMLLDPAYTNYMDMAKRCAIPTISIRRELSKASTYAAPDLHVIAALIERHRPAGLVIIPADNPTGHFMRQQSLVELARLCVREDMWLVSDEAYRQLHYTGEPPSSIWLVTEEEVPGITGARISIESASKVWNACGLRIGALVTDNAELHSKAVAEYTANLSANAIGQYIFGALADVPQQELLTWYQRQRRYYADMMREVVLGFRTTLPGVVVSEPEASLYSVIDVRALAPVGCRAADFVRYCAERGRVDLDGAPHTVLVAPMGGFYAEHHPTLEPSDTQMRLAYVQTPEQMRKVPDLFARLFRKYVKDTVAP